MKRFPLCLSALAFFLSNVLSADIARFKDFRLGFNLTSSILADSNINGNALEEDDVVFAVTPSFSLSRNFQNVDFSASLGLNFVRYRDNSQLDNSNWLLNFQLSPKIARQSDRFTFSASTNFSSDTRSDDELGRVITERSYGGSASLVYRVNPRLTASSTFSTSYAEPEDSTLSDSWNNSLSGSLQRSFSRRLALFASVTYQWSITDSPNTDNSTSTNFSIGASGQLSAKIAYSLNVGVSRRDSDFDSDSTPTYGASLSYALSETTSLSLTATTTLADTAAGSFTESRSLAANLSHSLSDRLSLGAFATLSETEFSSNGLFAVSRSDQRYQLGGNLSFRLNRFANLSLSHSFLSTDSDTPNFNFVRHQTRITANLSF